MPDDDNRKSAAAEDAAEKCEQIVLISSRETAVDAVRSLNKSGCNPICLADAMKAYSYISQGGQDIHLLLVEVVAPLCEGADIIRALKMLPEAESIPILAIVEGHQAAVESIRAGAVDYVPRVEIHTATFTERLERIVYLPCADSSNDRPDTEKTPKVSSGILDMLRYVNYAQIARALSRDYLGIYYVDVQSGAYIEYSANNDYDKLGIEKRGFDFFSASIENIRQVVHEEDQERLIKVLSEKTFIDELKKSGIFTINYRLILDGQPIYVCMKITRIEDASNPYIIIGIYSIQREVDQLRESNTYSGIAKALAADYFSIYYVDTETDEFIEFSSTDNYLDLGIEKRGSNFFELCRINAHRVIYHEDQKMLIKAMDKGYILHELEKNGTFTLTYRLMYSGKPTYVSLKATKMKDPGDTHIVIGITSIDSQIKRERELNTAREIANRDALTGVKSKHAFVETQEQINIQIQKDAQIEFAVVVCDLNDLKVINDTLGHNAGDKYIKNASEIICHTFPHSPVFRIGGDEFVVIISGSDYTIRDEQFAGLLQNSLQNLATGGVVIACGMSEYDPDKDCGLESVFDRADKKMYENKNALKGGRQ